MSALIVSVSFGAGAAFAQTSTTFTYQGELRDSGGLANGTFDMAFTLWTAVSGEGQVGATIALAVVPLADGRFAVELDYGSDAFSNQGRNLEIAVEGFRFVDQAGVRRRRA